MNLGRVLRLGFGALTFVFLGAVAAPPVLAAEGKPNVVFILADNVGYGDLGPYGGGELRGAPTPRIDALAREGLRLTQFLVEPGCTPSRAALMTGCYSNRVGVLGALGPNPAYREPAAPRSERIPYLLYAIVLYRWPNSSSCECHVR